ncbi:MAG: RNA polymerase sigma factor [Alphaproteobacteria bacterium]|nr:RNA polymerase sigma factor [Alphaproteobacteria bacterium]MBU0796990.1 RNA polymerase sigma factor [Alphaproteobacteria bacterium]MBU0886799.1 RNA polymerase sigma factor [Alphaproteobacteria bacterium]MBU1812459.1 RNA polymerase sigma factor [Alphaproteobacteria bacterium]MBU2089890.1 RNA polymerase sigma factor [Alphaproteobacteria bacterium]
MTSWRQRLAGLFEEHARALTKVAARRLRDPETAREIVQDVYVRLLQSGGTGRTEDDTRILYASVRNAVIDHHRSLRSRNRALDSIVPEQIGWGEGHSPEDQAAARESLSALDRALLELRPQAREMFILHRIEGIPNDRLAKIYGISVSAVEKQLARVLRHCQKALGEHRR